jgi:hypothetical protein
MLGSTFDCPAYQFTKPGFRFLKLPAACLFRARCLLDSARTHGSNPRWSGWLGSNPRMPVPQALVTLSSASGAMILAEGDAAELQPALVVEATRRMLMPVARRQEVDRQEFSHQGVVGLRCA